MTKVTERKKIAFLLSSYALGGMEMRSLRMAKLFFERGYDMYYGCPRKSKLAGALEGSGVCLFACNIHGSLDLWSGARLACYLREEKIQAIMAFTGSDYWMAILAARLASVPVFLSRSTAYTLNPMTVWVSRKADRLIAVSESIKKVLVQQGIPPAKIEVIYNGVDTNIFSAKCIAPREMIRNTFDMPNNKFIVGCLGRAAKGQHILLSLHSLLQPSCPDIHYFFAGQDIHQRLKPLVEAQPDLKLKTTLKESIPYEDIPAVLYALDAVVMLPEKEPFSNAVIEAMAMEKPVVLSRTFGNTEVVEDGVSGVLVDISDTRAVAEAVIRLHKDPHRCRTMGRAARIRAQQLYSQLTMLANYEKLWCRFINP
jgi:glycosyltransferase involved in cell wall biosynthesis